MGSNNITVLYRLFLSTYPICCKLLDYIIFKKDLKIYKYGWMHSSKINNINSKFLLSIFSHISSMYIDYLVDNFNS